MATRVASGSFSEEKGLPSLGVHVVIFFLQGRVWEEKLDRPRIKGRSFSFLTKEKWRGAFFFSTRRFGFPQRTNGEAG